MKKKKFFTSMAVIFTALVFISASATVDTEKMQEINEMDLSINPQDIIFRSTVKPDLNFGKLPLYFIFNKGQVNEKAMFYAKASRYTLWLTKEGLVFDSFKKIKVKSEEGKEKIHPTLAMHPFKDVHNQFPDSPSPSKIERDVSSLVFLDANKNPEIIAIEETKLRVNYFIGNDKSKWHCNVPTSQAVLYKNLYKDIDLKVYGIEKQMEYDFLVKPGGNPGDIRFEYKNVKGTRLDDEGNLLIETDFGELVHKRPVSYQKRDACPNERREVNVTFKKIDKNTFGFEVEEYDKSCELIIDPVVLAYSTYLGGGGEDYGTGINVDNSGNVYVTGYTNSTDFPTLGQYQTFQGNYDAFVTKINTTQSGAASLIYSTFLGGGDSDYSYGIAVDNSGYAYVTGRTESIDFPILNQYQANQLNSDVFVTKLDTNRSGASSLIYSTYLGGRSWEYGQGISVDNSGNAYITGITTSENFPTRNQYQTDQGSYEVFVTRIDTTKSGNASLIYSTYLGGNSYDTGFGIAVDSNGCAYVTGETYSTNFPIRNQYQTHQSELDVFVAKIDTNRSGASSLLYSTYLGGGDWDRGHGIVVDNQGNAYVTGWSLSTDFPLLNQYSAHNSCNYDAFVTKIDTTQSGASSLIYSSFLGGSWCEGGYGIAKDNSGDVYVTGYHSTNGYSTFVKKIDTTQSGASSLIYSTYLNGNGDEKGRGIAVDSNGYAYVTGETTSTDFPIRNQYQTDPGDNSPDAFVTKLFHTIVSPTVTTTAVSSVTATSASGGGNVTSDGDSAVTVRGVCWSTSPDPTISNSHSTDGTGTGTFTSTITGLTPGTTYHVRAYATNSVGTSYGNDVTFTTNAVAPIVTTTAVSNITSTTASSGGNVTDAGGTTVTARGVCWSTSINPTTTNSLTTDGTGTGTFTSSITGLTPGTTYHVRAYATNSVGTSYGNDVIFTTNAVVPTITTTAVSNLTSTTASSGGNVTTDGGAAVVTRGVCWSTSANPTTTNSHTTDGAGSGTFTSSITGLTPGTTYHVRAYATNSVGTSYGNDVIFTTNTVIPTVTTSSVSNITTTTASSGGNITNDGGAAVTARGVCWSTSANPTTTDNHTTDGTGTGTFTSSITGLTPGTTYHVRAYATNSVGTSYGNDVTFTTNAVAPTVTTISVSNITATTASSGGNITSDGGAAVTARGVCWSTSANPTTTDSHTTDGTGTGTFTSSITGLTPNTSYYLRSYATNIAGTSYGDQVTFTTAANPTISGIVTDALNPIKDVIITFSHDNHTETTDKNGHYSYTVPYGITTTITPSKTGYSSWIPANKKFTDITSNKIQDFKAGLNTYTISGTVTDGANPIEGVSITFSHDKHIEITDAAGDYSYRVEYGTSSTISASKPGYSFTPSEYSLTNLSEDKPHLDFNVVNSITVSITNPHDGDTVSGTVFITAEASSTDSSAADSSIQSIAKVEFYIDGIFVKKDTRTPYEHRWDTTLVSNGTHTIRANAYNSSGLTTQHEITANVNNSTEPPHIQLNRTRLNFGAVIGDSHTGFQTFLIDNSGGGSLSWDASVSHDWIQVSPSIGPANMLVSVSIDVTGLLSGSYTGSITIADANADNSPAQVDIHLEVKERAQEMPLFGSFDSPTNGSVVCCSIPVTGWALDDVEVSTIKIFRSPLDGHETGLIYIGDAVFVEGARTDVEKKYPDHPKNYQAGWGYMMLTNFLPNQGTGTFEIIAIATDSSGNEVPLGNKTITCDNANAVKPFGAIDTPTQGGDASGTDFINFGWALTPQPRIIPKDGSTIKVWVDGVPLNSHPVYNRYREDIAERFPGYKNSNGAVGYYYLDTTLYANGVHTIAWSVTDSAGNTDGIGSRYFRILNVENLSTGSTSVLGHMDIMTLKNLPVLSTPIHFKKGYKVDSEQYVLYPDTNGSITIYIKEDERIEIQLGDKNEIAGNSELEEGRIDSWSGFLLNNYKQNPLPIGSTLDATKGIFYWQPGTGFIGEYRFVFIEKGLKGELKKKNIKLIINKKF